jgi:hypothetical protein
MKKKMQIRRNDHNKKMILPKRLLTMQRIMIEGANIPTATLPVCPQ